MDKINIPFNEVATKKIFIKPGKEVLESVKKISGKSEKVPFKNICECRGGKMLTKSNFIEGKYPVIGGGMKPTGFHNNFNKDKNTILCSKLR